MSPGTYLILRRRAGGLRDVPALVGALLRLPECRVPTGSARALLEHRLVAAERNDLYLGEFPLTVLARVMSLDIQIYRRLVALVDDPEATFPRLCWMCGCSDRDACLTPFGPCAWSAANLCTRCAPLDIVAGRPDRPDAALPEGHSHA